MDTELWLALGVGALCGAAVGTERQWSGHADGDDAHFGGLRTFTMLGAIAGAAGWLWINDARLPGLLLLGGAAAVIVVSYVAASRRDIDGTTEVAAFVVLAAGLIAGLGQPTIASGMVAAAVLLLAEKTELHALVRRVDDQGIRAGARFAVMALVILPLLPEGPFPALGDLRPRQLWILVLLFSGLSFAGYVARAIVGEQHGLRITGLLGGLVSSTSVTLTFSRLSRSHDADSGALAAGTVAACTILFPRVVVAGAILHPPIAPPLAFFLTAPFLVGVAAVLWGARRHELQVASTSPANPLQIGAALQMALLFHVVWVAITYAEGALGTAGLAATAVVTGLTDVDALTASLALRAREGLPPLTAAMAIALGIAANTVLKLALSVALGSPVFRVRAGVALAAMVAAALVPLAVFAR
jgi:uncharacterized membrane protein (DUF4010 family)